MSDIDTPHDLAGVAVNVVHPALFGVPKRARSVLFPPDTAHPPDILCVIRTHQASHPGQSVLSRPESGPYCTFAADAAKVLQTFGLRLVNPRPAQYWWFTPSPWSLL